MRISLDEDNVFGCIIGAVIEAKADIAQARHFRPIPLLAGKFSLLEIKTPAMGWLRVEKASRRFGGLLRIQYDAARIG